jgi:hypothetical protein
MSDYKKRIIDQWEAEYRKQPKAEIIPFPRPREYRTPESTIDAFWYVVRLNDREQLAAWLNDHPRDKAFLLQLLEDKQ